MFFALKLSPHVVQGYVTDIDSRGKCQDVEEALE